MPLIDDLLPFDCAKAEPRSLGVDTVVVHFISALHWDNVTAGDLAAIAGAGIVLPATEPEARKFHPAYCRALLVKARLSYHYPIDRDGSVIRLVSEDRVAWHAGVSRMPTDGREWVNSFSIGVSFIATHPDDDQAVASGTIPGFTTAQYHAFARLLADIRTRHPVTAVVGHDEIAPGRKKDPGPLFDWARFRADDYSPLLPSAETGAAS
jgi:N-acetyl-anhydromuramyl-L-alanine amidase AmpD